MAEFSFQEVMRQLNRLCSHYHNCDERGCPMFDECGNIGAHCSAPKHSYRLEKIVMDWAAEHPEPVYPTFAEWLYEPFLKWCQANHPGRAKDEKAWFDYLYETLIPADIAQKLGIQPKDEVR